MKHTRKHKPEMADAALTDGIVTHEPQSLLNHIVAIETSSMRKKVA